MALRHCIDYIAPQFWTCTPQVWHYISYTALTTMLSIYIKDLKCVYVRKWVLVGRSRLVVHVTYILASPHLPD